MLSANRTLVPSARTRDLIVNFGTDEVLVYDERTHHLHRLNATATRVWFLCDGRKTVRDVATEARLPEEAILLSLERLADAHLLESPVATDLRTGSRRRRLLRKVSGMNALPDVISRLEITNS